MRINKDALEKAQREADRERADRRAVEDLITTLFDREKAIVRATWDRHKLLAYDPRALPMQVLLNLYESCSRKSFDWTSVSVGSALLIIIPVIVTAPLLAKAITGLILAAIAYVARKKARSWRKQELVTKDALEAVRNATWPYKNQPSAWHAKSAVEDVERAVRLQLASIP